MHHFRLILDLRNRVNIGFRQWQKMVRNSNLFTNFKNCVKQFDTLTLAVSAATSHPAALKEANKDVVKG